ncbi:hypothetical protein IYY11_01985 [Methylocystis sp. H62]|uniref:hypothetical protein n=1 Tax=Methylocystis sp. H62 TaxID=2785789 RepID=UPI0018C30536|nr:hypothetical protein [Methylocystis sp. H62]MBG0792243.1 hypothetical protein [Methylocystis sp. H62]
MNSADWVIFLMLSMSVTCFLLYVLQSMGCFSPKPVEPAKVIVEKARGLSPATVPEMTELLRATAARTDSLGKIGPTLTSLIGAILFAAIAALATMRCPGPTPSPRRRRRPRRRLRRPTRARSPLRLIKPSSDDRVRGPDAAPTRCEAKRKTP